MELARAASQQLMREICGQPKGTIYVSQSNLATAVKTRKFERTIGKNARADRLRGWLAQAVDINLAMLLDPSGLEWMGPQERAIAKLRLQILDTVDPQEARTLTTQLDCLEAQGAVLTWAAENEEPPSNNNPVVLRQERRAQLRTARNRIWKRLGSGAMNAAILMLVLTSQACPETDAGSNIWIEQAATWAVLHEWTSQSVPELIQSTNRNLAQMRAQHKGRDGHRQWDKVLDLGEGWGSIGIAAEGVECATIGVDIAGVLYQGTLLGHIRARVHMNLRRLRRRTSFSGSPKRRDRR